MEAVKDLCEQSMKKIMDLHWEIMKIKDKAMDADLDELASELNAIHNRLEVDARRLNVLKLKAQGL